MLSPFVSGEAHDSPLVRPGCREMEMELELEGVVVTAEVEQGRGPSSTGQGFTAGSVEASLRSRLPRCGDPRFGFRSPGPGAEKDIERWGGRIRGSGWATTRRPRSKGSRAHRPQGRKAELPPTQAPPRPRAVVQSGGPWLQACIRDPSSTDGPSCKPWNFGWKAIKEKLRRTDKMLVEVQHINYRARLPPSTAYHANP